MQPDDELADLASSLPDVLSEADRDELARDIREWVAEQGPTDEKTLARVTERSLLDVRLAMWYGRDRNWLRFVAGNVEILDLGPVAPPWYVNDD